MSFLEKNAVGVLLHCLDKDETKTVLKELHSGPVGGHFGGEITAHKVLRVRYYWSILFQDSYAHAKKCQDCETTTGRVKKPAFPLQPVSMERPF